MITAEEIENRFGYHKATDETAPLHQTVRQLFINQALQLDALLPDGRAKSEAFTCLQTAAMYSNFAIAERAPVVKE